MAYGLRDKVCEVGLVRLKSDQRMDASVRAIICGDLAVKVQSGSRNWAMVELVRLIRMFLDNCDRGIVTAWDQCGIKNTRLSTQQTRRIQQQELTIHGNALMVWLGNAIDGWRYCQIDKYGVAFDTGGSTKRLRSRTLSWFLRQLYISCSRVT